MQEMQALRDWLGSQKGDHNLTSIAIRTGISRRTVQRIVNDTGYSVNLKTFSALRAEMEKQANSELRTEQVAA